jgi:hypothetical protein
LMAMEALYRLCSASPAAQMRAHRNQAAVRTAAAVLAAADAAAPPPEEVACFLAFVAGGFWSCVDRECDTPFATAAAAAAKAAAAAAAVAERVDELPMREVVDALPSLIRVAVRLAASSSTKAALFALTSLSIVLLCAPFKERAAGRCDAAACAFTSPGVAKSLRQRALDVLGVSQKAGKRWLLRLTGSSRKTKSFRPQLPNS